MGSLWVPSDVRLSSDGDSLICSPAGTVQRVGPDMLTRFLRIAETSEPGPEIVKFASRFGTFQLCRHDLPARHSAHNLIEAGARSQPECRVRVNRRKHSVEPVRVWHIYARDAASLIRIAAQNREGQPGYKDDWHRLRRAQLRPRSRAFRVTDDPLTIERRRLLEHIEAWLTADGARPFVSPYSKSGTLEISGGLMAALAMALLGVINGSKLHAVCTNCGQLYQPSRRPASSRQHYCNACRDRARWLHAQRRRRAKRRETV